MNELVTSVEAKVALALILAVCVEALVEYFGEPVPEERLGLPETWKRYAAAVVGVIVCIGWGADLLAALGYPARYPFAGEVLTGLLIARGSNFINDLLSLVSVAANAAKNTRAGRWS